MKKQVDERERELKQAKKELREHTLEGDKVLMVIQAILMKYGLGGALGMAITFFDNGSTCSDVVNTFARKQGLYGKVTISLTTVNEISHVDTRLYLVELLDKEGRRHVVKAFGLKNITGNMTSITYGNLRAEFSPAVQEVWASLTNRPSGVVVDLLVGSEAISLHPVCLELRGDMMATRSKFGEGYVLERDAP
jgi:hypothetical protein